jgi:hypothetical protein
MGARFDEPLDERASAGQVSYLQVEDGLFF